MSPVRYRPALSRFGAVRIATTALISLLALCVCAPLAAGQTLDVQQGSSTSAFPARTLVVSVPQGSSVTPGRVHVTENGEPVTGLSINPLSQANRGDLGVIIVVDSDPSMAGAPLRQAMVAARALAARRTGNEELGLVYGDGTSVPLTSDSQVINRGLSRVPRVGHAINLLRGAKFAIDELTAAHVADGAVIFVTDDIDKDPTYTPASIAALARASHVRIFAVGIRDSAFAHPNSQDLPPSALSVLARAAAGTFTAADPAELAGIFKRIEAGLMGQYVVHYRSAQVGGRAVFFSVRVDGVSGTYTGRYYAPYAGRASRPGHRGPRKAFWNSSLAVLLVAIACAALLGFAVAVLVKHYARGGALRNRVTAFLAEAPMPEELRPVPRPDEEGGLFARARWWPIFERNVEIGHVTRSAKELAYIAVGGSLVTGIVLQLTTGLLPLAIAAMTLPPLAVRAFVNRAVDKHRQLFLDQFPGLIHEIAGAMRTGRSLVEALTAVMGNADQPSRREFARVITEERAGRHIEDALRPVGDRMSCEEIEQVAVVAGLNRRTGANITEVLDRVADTARQRGEIRRELRGLTAQARLSRNILIALPPFVVIALSLLAGDFEKPLFNTAPGLILLVICSGMVAVGAKIMKAIVNIEE